MNSQQRNLFAAAGLALALAAPAATAGLIVAGTPDSGYVGDHVNPTLTITSAGVPDLHQAITWDFTVDWNESVLGFNDATIAFGTGGADTYSGSISGLAAFLGGIGDAPVYSDNALTAVADGYFSFHWESDPSLTNHPMMRVLDLGDGIVFTGDFTIISDLGASVDTDYLFGFVNPVNSVISDITDQNLDSGPAYGAVTSGSPEMKVTVLAPQAQPAPEPGMPMLLLGGLAAFFAARRMRGVTLN